MSALTLFYFLANGKSFFTDLIVLVFGLATFIVTGVVLSIFLVRMSLFLLSKDTQYFYALFYLSFK